MKAFLRFFWLQCKLDYRNRGALLTYYMIPLIFFLLMGAVFSTINPEFSKTLIQTMTAFSITMGAILGTPVLLSELYREPIRKAFRVGKIPLWATAAGELMAGFVHLFIVAIIIFLAAPKLYGAELPSNLLLYFGATAFYILVSLCVGLLLGMCVSGAKLTMISQLIFLPSLLLSGMMFPADMLPKAVATAGRIFPATQIIRLTTSEGASFAMFLPMVVILVIIIVAITLRLKQLQRV